METWCNYHADQPNQEGDDHCTSYDPDDPEDFCDMEDDDDD